MPDNSGNETGTPEDSGQQANASQWQKVADQLCDRIDTIANHDWTDAEKVEAITEALAGLPDGAGFMRGPSGWDLEIWTGDPAGPDQQYEGGPHLRVEYFPLELTRPESDLLSTALYTGKLLPPDQVGLTNTAYFLANAFKDVDDALGSGNSGAAPTPAKGAPPDAQPPTDTPSVLRYSDDSALGKPDMQGTWDEEQPTQPDPAGQNVEGLQGDPVTASPPEGGTLEARITGQSGDVPVLPEVEPIPSTPPGYTPSVLRYADEVLVVTDQGTSSGPAPSADDQRMAEAKAVDDARLERAKQNVEGLQGDPVTASPPEGGTLEVRITSQSGEASEAIEIEPIPETPPILNADSVLSYAAEEGLVMVGGDPTMPLAPTPTPEQLRDARDDALRELLSEPLEEFPEEHVIVRPGVLPVDDEPGRLVSGDEQPTFLIGPTASRMLRTFPKRERLRTGQRMIALIRKHNRKRTVLVGFGAGAAALLALALFGVFGGGGDNTVASSGGADPAPVNPLVAVQPQQPAQPTATLTPVPAPETAGVTGAQGSQDGVPATGSDPAAGPAPSNQEQAPAPQEQAPAPVVQEPAPIVQQPPTVNDEVVLQPNGTVHVILDNTVTKITGNCPLASPSNPGQQIAVNDHVPGQGNWTLGGSGNPLTLASSDGLSGVFNPATSIFTLQSADGTRSSTGPISGDGLNLSGTSVFKPSGTCTLDLSFTGSFNKPLFVITTVPGTAASSPPVQVAPPAPAVDPFAAAKAGIEEAYEGAFTNAVRTGDETYLFSHDSDIAFDYYGFNRCQEHFANVPPDPTFTIVVTGEITGPSVWSWVYQGNVIGENIPDVYSVPAQVTQKGLTASAVLHGSWNGDLIFYGLC